MQAASQKALRALSKTSSVVKTARSAPVAPCRCLHYTAPVQAGPSRTLATSADPVASSSSESARSYRERFAIEARGPPGIQAPAPYETFAQAGWSNTISEEIRKQGYPSPTPIQAQCWPIALQNSDLVAISSTGSGKTLGFLLPIIKKLVEEWPPVTDSSGPPAVILAPTRELADQIAEHARNFGRAHRLKTAIVVGGAPRTPQARALSEGPAIVVATPGRMIDMLNSGYTTVDNVKCLVLDEADRMLDMGFGDQIQKILQGMPDHQTLMFSATWPTGVRSIAQNYMKDYFQLSVGGTGLVANKSIVQKLEFTSGPVKRRLLIKHLEELSGSINKVLIFVGTKAGADLLSEFLHKDGWPVFAMHGDKSQGERSRLLSEFRSGKQLVMIATDVASRGIDVSDVTCVINYDFPATIEDYVHRIGRTARGSRTGTSITFFTENDGQHARDLVKVMTEANQPIPSELQDAAMRHDERRGRSPYGDRGRNYGGRGFGDRNGFGGDRGSGRGAFGRPDRQGMAPRFGSGFGMQSGRQEPPRSFGRGR